MKKFIISFIFGIIQGPIELLGWLIIYKFIGIEWIQYLVTFVWWAAFPFIYKGITYILGEMIEESFSVGISNILFCISCFSTFTITFLQSGEANLKTSLILSGAIILFPYFIIALTGSIKYYADHTSYTKITDNKGRTTYVKTTDFEDGFKTTKIYHSNGTTSHINEHTIGNQKFIDKH